MVLGALLGGVLIEGFSTNISKSFVITGRLRDQGIRRLQQNNRHLAEIFLPGGLERDGDGWKLSVRLRLVHAQIRRLLQNSEDWDAESWGTPLSSAHMGFAITAFSARLLKHMKSLGAVMDEEERKSFMAVWRYTGYLMGIPETILFRDESEALKLFRVGAMCEPEPSAESIIMAHSLINSSPIVLGMTDPVERRRFARYVFSVSHGLIGNRLARQLSYPTRSAFGVLPWFRLQQRFGNIRQSAAGRIIPRGAHIDNPSQLTALIDSAVYDEAGITYGVPDHVYSEESSRW